MIRRLAAVLLLVTGALALAPALLAQAPSPFLFLGGGVTVPMSEFGDSVGTGWMGTVGFGVPVGTAGRVAIGGEAYFGRNSYDDAVLPGDKSNLYGAAAWVGYRFGEAGRIAPYVLGSAGGLAQDFHPEAVSTDTDTEFRFAWSAGAGVDIPLSSSISLYIEGRYMGRGHVKMIPILAGFSFSLGRGS